MRQRSKQRYSNMLWNMWSITRHKRSYCHQLQPDLTPDVLTCVLPLGTVSSGRESEVESAHLFLTIIQFSAHVILLLNTQTLAYTTQSYHTHLHTPKVLWRWASDEAVGVGYTGSCSCRPAHRRLSSTFYMVAFREEKQSAELGSRLSD